MEAVMLRGQLLGNSRGAWATGAAVAFFFFHQVAQAATISVIAEATCDHPARIEIKGRFGKGEHARDIATFAAIASAQSHGAVVFLEGPGVSALAAIRIGQIINRREFSTVVVS